MERKYKILQVDPNNKDAIRFFGYDFVKDQGFLRRLVQRSLFVIYYKG